MTREEAIAYFKRHIDLYCVEGISKESEEMAIKALEQEPCEDTISRQAVIDINEHHHWQMPNRVNHEIWEEIKALPSVAPEPKIGHWIELGYLENDNYDFECSVCHHTDTHSKTVKVNYCWNCGAKMEDKE